MTLRRIVVSTALLAVLARLRRQQGHDRAAGRAHRVRGDARRAEAVEQQGRRQVGAAASRVAAGDRRCAHLCRRLRRPSRSVRRRDRRQSVVGQDGASADGRPRASATACSRSAPRTASCCCSMPRRATSGCGRRSAARCSRRRPSAPASSPCAPSTGGCAVSRRRTAATLWTVEQSLPTLTLRGNTAPRRRRHARDQRLQQRPRRRLRDRGRRSRVGSRRRESHGTQRARALGRRQRGLAGRRQRRLRRRAITAAPSASISRPVSCSGSRTCRRMRAWAPTSTTST